jgi:hypothetical protein
MGRGLDRDKQARDPEKKLIDNVSIAAIGGLIFGLYNFSSNPH